MAKDRYKIKSNTHPHFITATTVNWIPVFAIPTAVEILYESLRYLQASDGLNLYGYVIMENHLHLIAAASDLSGVIRRFKSYTARRIIDFLGENGYKGLLSQLNHFKSHHRIDSKSQLWQEGSHPKQIQNEDMMRQKLDYMHCNPVRRGYIDDPLAWRYSSARNYVKQEGLIEVITNW